eukprot:2189538-Pleurochrysis_carterae.AAC.2
MIVNNIITTKDKVSLLDGLGIRATVITRASTTFRHEEALLAANSCRKHCKTETEYPRIFRYQQPQQ